jgi:hypothetical protein
MSGQHDESNARLLSAVLAAQADKKHEPAAQPQLRLLSGRKLNVRIVSALLRCTSCKAEWHGNVNQSGAVTADSARCPKCSTHSTADENPNRR